MGRGANGQFALTITASSGFQYAMWDGGQSNLHSPLESLWLPPIPPGAAPGTLGKVPPSGSPPRGNLVGADLQLGAAGGWTFATMRYRVVCPPNPWSASIFDWGSGTFTSAGILQSWTLFDSGTLLAAAIIASNTDAFIRENFSDRPQPFGSWLMLCLDWTTSAGAGTSNLTATIHTDLAETALV